MIGLLLMGVVALSMLFLMFAKVYPGMIFRYTGRGERKARAEYQRIKREHPDAPEAQVSEAEFVESFVQNGPSPWKWLALLALLGFGGLPISCAIGAATM